MADEQTPAPESWRIVVFTNIPGGVIYSLVNEVVRPLGHRVVGVVTSPGPKRRRSPTYLEVVAAVSPGVDVIVSNHPERWAAMLAPLRPDLIVSGGFPWRIPADVLALPRLGAINFHDALLPRHRGPNATGWAFRMGDTETGLTIHRLTPEFDTGPILAQAGVPITDDDNLSSLMAKLVDRAPGLLRRALERVAQGEEGDPQDESQATEAGLFEDAWRIIDWNQSARTIHNQVRSWVGFRDIPAGALGDIDGETVQITKTRLAPTGPAKQKPVQPGTVVRRDDESLVVQCGDGPIAILSWSPA
ncbi:MAG TPA: methionyl-tRNA formyltransferase [Thermomicrobiales bacterium]|nr:methionyl-tRNA formyltransferase [Thermomicrobiales bacterium]